MLDKYNRQINYLRLSVTDRCNFRCVYCLPSQGTAWRDHSEILTYEEMLKLIKIFNKAGITKIRLTGGEPLLRKGLVEFVASIKALGVIADISLTTNGSLLAPLAEALKIAGLNRVNISLDTINPVSFNKITTCGCLADTLAGIESALKAGLTPVKLNVVLTDALTERDLDYFTKLINSYPISVRFIEYMPINNKAVPRGMDIAMVKKLLGIKGRKMFKPSTVIQGNGPAKYYHSPKAQGSFGFITPISEHFCGTCNRMRLTADGRLKPCLLSNTEIDIKTPLRNGASDRALTEIFHNAIRDKLEGHLNCWDSGYPWNMSQVGG
ncbi:MAG: moaA 2 [Firmicutes bacterium]|nr:moaA 2 [Bacillota bacterium]